MNNEFILLFLQFLILIQPAFFPFSKFYKNFFGLHPNYLNHNLLTFLQPFEVFFIFKSMPSFVLGNIEPAFENLNNKWKFRQIMVIEPVTSDRLSFSLFAQMPKYFLQPVFEH